MYILCTLLGITIGIFATIFSKKSMCLESLVKLTTNNGWNWTIWKNTSSDYALATLKKGTKDVTVLVDDHCIIVQFDKKSISINTNEL